MDYKRKVFSLVLRCLDGPQDIAWPAHAPQDGLYERIGLLSQAIDEDNEDWVANSGKRCIVKLS